MTILPISTLIEWTRVEGEGQRCVDRVLYFCSVRNLYALIDIFSPNPLPRVASFSEIETAFAAGAVRILTADPYLRCIDLAKIPAKHLEKRDAAWELVAPIVEAPGLAQFLPETRGKLIQAQVDTTGKQYKAIYKQLRRYWLGGQIKNALLPNYGNCGSNSAWRETGDHKRLGRPSVRSKVEPESNGTNISAEVKKKFRNGIDKFFLACEKSSLRRAFQRTLENYFHIGYEFRKSVAVPVLPPADQLPSFRQFSYWYENEYRNVKRDLTAKLGRIEYEMNHRALLGDTRRLAYGPGSVYQIDATVGDIYLVSAFDRTRGIGRPIIYISKDWYSGYITGLAVTLEGPSWAGAMLALDNVAADKVAFCADHGIEISEDEWNSSGLPESILADRGEFESYNADPLVDGLRIRVSNTPPFRGDMKGPVERGFGMLNEKLINLLPGAVKKGPRRGKRDYRLDATFTLKEFRTLVIKCALNYNATCELTSYKPDEAQIADQVDLVPQDLWDWGIKNRSGHLRTLPRDVVRLHLLPRKSVSVTKHGIGFHKDMFYTCELAVREGWFEKARNRGTWRIDVAYDPQNLDHIYIPHKDGQEVVTCSLTESARVFHLKDWCDALDYFASRTVNKDIARTRTQRGDAELNAQIEQDVAAAREKTEAARRTAGPQSQAARTRGIRDNRKEERTAERENNVFDLSGKRPAIEETETLANLPEDEEYIPAPSNLARIRELRKGR